MGLLTIGDESFNVVVEGADDLPALMLSNSLGANLQMWDAQMPALRARFRVIRYDGRGHGASTAPAGPYSIDQLGRDALAIMDALGLAKVSWIGLSMGGMVGQWLLAHAPERIERAVLANTAAHLRGTDVWNARISIVRAAGMAAITDSVIARWFTPGFVARASGHVAPIVAMLHATPPQGYAGCCAAIRDMDLREAIRGADVSVLVVVGREDPSTPPADGEEIAAAIPGAKLVTLDASHLSNIEDAEVFTKVVVDFLTARAHKPAARRLAPATAKGKPKAAAKPARAAPKRAPVTKPKPAAAKRRPKTAATTRPVAGKAKPVAKTERRIAAPARKKTMGTSVAAKKTGLRRKPAAARRTATKITAVKAKAAEPNVAKTAGKTAGRRVKPAAAKRPAAKTSAKRRPASRAAARRTRR